MKILSFNVNGLQKNVATAGSPKSFLDSLDADIICLQEVKLTRGEYDVGLEVVDGYDSYMCLTTRGGKSEGPSRKAGGYSGVAVYCRLRMAPVAAEQGMTGMVWGVNEDIGGYGDMALRWSKEELVDVDKEGRCVIVDFGSFVLFNLYCPSAHRPEKESADHARRFQLKQRFQDVLEARCVALRASGREVILVGDFNITHRKIDCKRPEEYCTPTEPFDAHPTRVWLSGFLERANVCDSFRVFHPERKNAFTFWSQYTREREHNAGRRLDYALVSDALMKERVIMCDIQPDVTGSDHCPVVLTLRDGLEGLESERERPALSGRVRVRRAEQLTVKDMFMSVPLKAKRACEGNGEEERVVKKAKSARKGGATKITSFFAMGTSTKTETVSATATHSDANTTSDGDVQAVPLTDFARSFFASSSSRATQGYGGGQRASAASWWKTSLGGPRSLPQCAHKEASVERVVKKEGPNRGRKFYTCARADGDKGDASASCGFFKWATDLKKQ